MEAITHTHHTCKSQAITADWRKRIRLCGLSLGAALGSAFFFSSPALAQDMPQKKAVIELYTSMGCKSCLAADAILAGLADQPDVLALSFHVSYWDYLGWRDTLAIPDSTDRQNDYKKAFATGAIYTPQAIVNGTEQFNGSDQKKYDAAMTAATLRVPVTVRETEKGRLTVDIGAGSKPSSPTFIKLFYFSKEAPVTIASGDNAGQKITYRNVVHDIVTVGMWDGKPITFDMPASEATRKNASGFAVLLQQVRDDRALGPILGANLYNLPVPASK
ncbi:DUF1223 domain-containing protein [Daeguia caeni]|uniref:DUF1223 domain-containing protein n=1 Tax=Daeguia caeni TaxID=439612 RepID=A0ABV9H7L7_9HYPH